VHGEAPAGGYAYFEFVIKEARPFSVVVEAAEGDPCMFLARRVCDTNETLRLLCRHMRNANGQSTDTHV